MDYAKFLIMSLLLVIAMAAGTQAVFAAGPTIDNVFLDGVRIRDTGVNGITGIERGEEVTIKVETSATEDIKGAQVEVQITGIRNEDVSDISDPFDMRAGVTYIKTLKLTLPDRADLDTYTLRARVEGRTGSTAQKDYILDIDAPRSLVTIRDITFDPEYQVEAGRSLLTTVRIKNMGENDDDSIKVRVSIPDLGIATTDYIDELDTDESVTRGDLYMRIPACTKPGEYEVRIEVTYDDGDETSVRTESIEVTADRTCTGYSNPGYTGSQGSYGTGSYGSGTGSSYSGTAGTASPSQTSITVPQSRQITIGSGGTAYPITITNADATSQSFALGATGIDTFGTYAFDPSNVLVVPAKGTATAFLYVTANSNAAQGKYTLALTVTTGKGTETIPLEAVVTYNGSSAGAGSEGLRRGLEIGLIVLVIILVLLGLLIAFTKMREREGSDSQPRTEEVIVTQEEKPVYY